MKTRRLVATLIACTLIPALALAALVAKPAKPLHISEGKEVKLEDYLVKGKTTIFDFYSVYCPPCMAIAPQVEKLHTTRDDIVVIKVDVNRPGVKKIDWDSPVVAQYHLQSIPHFKVYGPDGKLRVEDGPDSGKARALVMSWFK
jgi:thiol-disulfide isomerase/thioredoxin